MTAYVALSDVFRCDLVSGANCRACHVRDGAATLQWDSQHNVLRLWSRYAPAVYAGYQVCLTFNSK